MHRTLNLGPFESKYKALDAFHCTTLLFRYRVQINLARDLRCGMLQERLNLLLRGLNEQEAIGHFKEEGGAAKKVEINR